jgi:hypothetical protein
VRHERWATVPWTCEIDDVRVMLSDQAIEVDVDQAETGRCTPMAKQSRLDVLRAQRLAQQRIVEQIDLRNRQIIDRVPVALHPIQQSWIETTHGGNRVPVRGSYGAREADVEVIRGGHRWLLLGSGAAHVAR